jgi:1,4-alpha-glucan branching enzyme
MGFSKPFKLDQRHFESSLFFGIPFVDSHSFQIFATVMCDILWLSINQAVHKGVIPEVLKLAENIQRVSSEHLAAWNQKLHPKTANWTKPPQDWSKVSFHAIIRNSFSTQAAMCRNHKGEISQIVTQVRPFCRQEYGEALAAKLAAELASSLQLDNVILEGESNIVITTLISLVCSLDTLLDLII